MTRLLRSGVINFGNLLPVLNNVYFSITLIILIYSSNQFYRTELFGIDNWYIFRKTEYLCQYQYLPESQLIYLARTYCLAAAICYFLALSKIVDHFGNIFLISITNKDQLAGMSVLWTKDKISSFGVITRQVAQPAYKMDGSLTKVTKVRLILPFPQFSSDGLGRRAPQS